MAKPYTISYSEEAKGWPSFYSYMPEYMIGMNSYFYSFRGGNLFRHNTNELRNNYYGVQYNSQITAVFNTEPQTIKLFKTLSYESDDRWECTALFTELGTGSMLDTYFEQKEREWFTFLRENTTTINYRARSTQGLGNNLSITGVPGAFIINFIAGYQIDSILAVGDFIYATPTPAAVAPIYFGQVTAVDRVNDTITVDEGVVDPQGVVGVLAGNGDFMVGVKNAQAESHGARGYFMQFTLENDATAAVELFSVGSSVMKSYP